MVKGDNEGMAAAFQHNPPAAHMAEHPLNGSRKPQINFQEPPGLAVQPAGQFHCGKVRSQPLRHLGLEDLFTHRSKLGFQIGKKSIPSHLHRLTALRAPNYGTALQTISKNTLDTLRAGL